MVIGRGCIDSSKRLFQAVQDKLTLLFSASCLIDVVFERDPIRDIERRKDELIQYAKSKNL